MSLARNGTYLFVELRANYTASFINTVGRMDKAEVSGMFEFRWKASVIIIEMEQDSVRSIKYDTFRQSK